MYVGALVGFFKLSTVEFLLSTISGCIIIKIKVTAIRASAVLI